MSDNPNIFYGSDFAPHPASLKAGWPPPAGCACYPAAISIVAEVFADRNRLDVLDDFLALRAARFYGIKLDPAQQMTIIEEEWQVPGFITIGSEGDWITPWLANETLRYGVV